MRGPATAGARATKPRHDAALQTPLTEECFMRLATPVLTRPLRSTICRLFALGALAALAAPAAADKVVLEPRTLDRRFPQGQFCALPVDLEFTSPGTTVRVVFEARRFIFDPNDQAFHWTEQYLDNVVIAAAADYDANFGPPPQFSSSELCYVGDPLPTPYFYFNRAGLTLPLMELFDADPASSGWDLSNGAYYRSDRSGPRNPELDTDDSGGSLGLGADATSPVGNEVATTEITVNGLTQAANYNLSAWWDVNHVVFGSTETMLTITIFGPEPTPIARRSWSGVKRAYR